MWLDRDSDSQEPAACSFKVLLGPFSPLVSMTTPGGSTWNPGQAQGPGRSRPGEVTARRGHGPGRSHSWGCAPLARGSVWLQPHAQPRCPALCENGPCGLSHLVLVTRGETCGTCPVTCQELAELGSEPRLRGPEPLLPCVRPGGAHCLSLVAATITNTEQPQGPEGMCGHHASPGPSVQRLWRADLPTRNGKVGIQGTTRNAPSLPAQPLGSAHFTGEETKPETQGTERRV